MLVGCWSGATDDASPAADDDDKGTHRRRRPWRLADTDWFNLFFARITIHGGNTGRAFHFTRVLYISIDHLSIRHDPPNPSFHSTELTYINPHESLIMCHSFGFFSSPFPFKFSSKYVHVNWSQIIIYYLTCIGGTSTTGISSYVWYPPTITSRNSF